MKKRFTLSLTLITLFLFASLSAFAGTTYNNSFNVSITGNVEVPNTLNIMNQQNRSILSTGKTWSPIVVEGVEIPTSDNYSLPFFIEGNFKNAITLSLSDNGTENFDGITTLKVSLTHIINSTTTPLETNFPLSLTSTSSPMTVNVDSNGAVTAGASDSTTTYAYNLSTPYTDNYYNLVLSMAGDETSQAGDITGSFKLQVTYNN